MDNGRTKARAVSAALARYARTMLVRRGAIVAGFAFGATLAACFADLAALSSGNVAAGDAALETSESDAALESGAAPDAAADGDADASPTTFCASAGPHTLCEDFDTAVVAGFSVVDDFGGGKGEKDTTQSFSPPASFRLTTPQVATAKEAWLLPTLTLPNAAKHVHVEAKVQACADGGDYVFMSVNNSAAADSYGAIDVGIHPIAGGFETYMIVKHDAFSKTFSLGPPLSSTRFTRLVLDTDIDKTTNGAVKLAIDGVVVVDTKSIATDQAGTVVSRAAWAGLYSYQSPACTAHVDDIIIDVQ